MPPLPSIDRPSVRTSTRLVQHFQFVFPEYRQYCQPVLRTRILDQLLATNSSSCTTVVQLTRGALSSPIYRAGVRGLAVDPREPPIV
ncbi:hypothetical protein T02_4332 [Trichinella nativa]|uniref:Uncharacterized protein n=1 Tax=Trichinella nativa TaxID=6335 RepID=A0A0V1KL74_9BILA|nr:hypothetical protein T02_4332 [Trichinella nativa]